MSVLSGLFAPDRVAVVGATDREGSVGRALLENLSSFDGELIPVNPNRETVLGQRCYPQLGAIPEPETVDIAVVVVPATVVTSVVGEAGEAGITNVVVVTAGFSEAGEAGQQRERDLIEVAQQYDLDLVGPNCVGVMSVPNGFNATFVGGDPPAGSISVMSQSGAFISAVLGWATQQEIGFKDVVSLGNEAVLDELDFLAHWNDDPDTDVILAYLEDIEDGTDFVETAREVTEETPVVVVKSGRTESGAAAAASHTGSIAGRDQAYQAGFHQGGVLRADDIEEAFDVGRVLSTQPLPERDDVAVVTNGGGPGVLATDAIDDSRLSVAEFDADTSRELAAVLPENADVTNPLDILGDAGVDRFRDALDTTLGADTVGGAVVLSVPTLLFEFRELAGVIGELQERHGKPVVACLMGGADADDAAADLRAFGIPNYFDPSRAANALESLADYRDVAQRTYDTPTEFDVDEARAREILASAEERDVDNLGLEAMALLDAYGIPTPAGGLAESPAGAATIADDIGTPVVMKIVSPDLLHKSDFGGVEVGVPLDDVRETYRRLRERARSHDPDATVLGVRVEALVDPDESTETIVGVSRDPQFDHLLMFGLGGIFVQIYNDTVFRTAPVTGREARQMTAEITAAPMLRGARGRTPADIDAVVETIQRVSQLVTDVPAITELDINPLVVSPDGVSAVDLRLTVDRAQIRK